MTAAPTQSLVERVARAICQAMPLAWVDTCRPSAPIPDGCLLPLDEETCDGRVLARAALAACRAEEMHELLTLIASYPDANVISDAHYVVRQHARALLAEQDGTAPGGAAQPMPPATDQPVGLAEDRRAIFEEGAKGYFHNGPVHPALYRSERVRPDEYFNPEVETAWRFFQYGCNSRPTEAVSGNPVSLETCARAAAASRWMPGLQCFGWEPQSAEEYADSEWGKYVRIAAAILDAAEVPHVD